MKRQDVESLVCATDAGREGELIFRLVYNQCRCKKPFERLWISSMEDAAIREGFEKLRPGTEYDALYEAALCRERADWIVGMNATRLFSCLYGTTLAVGRVMTPTLGMAVMREAEIRAFKPEIFYEVELQFSGISAKSDRIKDLSEVENALQACRYEVEAKVLSSVRKEKTEKPPALYDLTSLQRDANRILGFTAQQTLDYTQSLYEKKLVTYPRTDSRYLTDDMAPALPEWLTKTSSADAKILYGFLLDRVSVSLKNGWKDEQNRVFIICTIEEIMEKLGCGNKKAIQLLSELEEKIGLIEKKRQGQGKPNLIYVKNFIRTVDNSGQRHFLTCQNDTSGSVEIRR